MTYQYQYQVSRTLSREALERWSQQHGPQYCPACGIDLCTNPGVRGLCDELQKEVVWDCDCQQVGRFSVCLSYEWLAKQLGASRTTPSYLRPGLTLQDILRWPKITP